MIPPCRWFIKVFGWKQGKEDNLFEIHAKTEKEASHQRRCNTETNWLASIGPKSSFTGGKNSILCNIRCIDITYEEGLGFNKIVHELASKFCKLASRTGLQTPVHQCHQISQGLWTSLQTPLSSLCKLFVWQTDRCAFEIVECLPPMPSYFYGSRYSWTDNLKPDDSAVQWL
jgi:hypothetical protein